MIGDIETSSGVREKERVRERERGWNHLEGEGWGEGEGERERVSPSRGGPRWTRDGGRCARRSRPSRSPFLMGAVSYEQGTPVHSASAGRPVVAPPNLL